MELNALTKLIRAAAAEAVGHQERFAAADTEARKIVDIMESFLRVKGRVVYGGAAINAHMPADQKFYDPAVNLPDYDFLTPDPLQDCADLIVSFQEEGFTDVEAKFGIHEGTYKVFVNYRAAADITYMPSDLYGRLAADAVLIDGIRYASPDYLRMNMYLELSRPAGDVSRWEKVYKRLLLMNEVHPPRAGRCVADPLSSLGRTSAATEAAITLYDKIVAAGIGANAVFLSGASYLASIPLDPDVEAPVLMLAANVAALRTVLTTAVRLKHTAFPAIGELLPARTEYHTAKGRLAAVVFETVSCHAYITLASPPAPEGYRLASLDLLIQMYYALYFTGNQAYLPVRLQCVVQSLIDIESSRRQEAAASGTAEKAHDVFPLDCIGYQPTLPELKKAHRIRVQAKRAELAGALRISSGLRPGRRTTQRRKKTTGK